ncbi:MAG: flagellar export protein FliJ [Treponema sp.]|nr:MAG: flagellar export protein FliJ [Treponema sp.]
MIKHTFRLEKILKLREFYEEKAKIELGKCISESEYIKQQLKLIANNRVSARKKMVVGADFSFNDFVAGETFIKRLEFEKEEQLNLLAQAELKVEQARKVYNEATKQRKILSKLKEKKEAQWRKERLQHDAEILDDLVNFQKSKM